MIALARDSRSIAPGCSVAAKEGFVGELGREGKRGDVLGGKNDGEDGNVALSFVQPPELSPPTPRSPKLRIEGCRDIAGLMTSGLSSPAEPPKPNSVVFSEPLKRDLRLAFPDGV